MKDMNTVMTYCKTLGSILIGLTCIWTVSIFSEGCTAGVQEVKLDAFFGMANGSGDLFELSSITESQLLVFNTSSGTTGITLDGQERLTLCESSTALLSNDSERLLCIPERLTAPLQFTDRLTGGTILSLPDWNQTSFAQPDISPTGNAFASPIKVMEDQDHIAVYDDFGLEVSRFKSLIFGGFVGPDHVVVNDPPEIWAFRPIENAISLEELEEVRLFPIGTRDFFPHKYSPYGVVYEERDILYFLEVDQEAARKVGEGMLIGLGERQAISLTREEISFSRVNVYRLDAESGSGPEFSMVVEDARFGQLYEAKMVSRETALFQQIKTRVCGEERIKYALSSYLIDFPAQRVIPLFTEGEPHRVAVSGLGRYGVVTHIDNCGRSMGNATLIDLESEQEREMPEQLRGKVRDVAVSARGEYIAVMGEDTVWLLDGNSLGLSVADSGDTMRGGLRFIQ